MCRLIAIPAGFNRDEALEILLRMEGDNKDGFGQTFINAQGEFVTRKWISPLSVLVKRNVNGVLDCLPHNGWVLAHSRSASRGYPEISNVHPFQIGKNWMICQNGTMNLSDFRLARICLKKFVELKSQTDTEICGQILSIVGPRRFCDVIKWAGIFLALNKSGHLWVFKTNYMGDLDVHKRENGTLLLASDLPYQKYKSTKMLSGWMCLNPDGSFNSKEETASYNTSSYTGSFHGSKWDDGEEDNDGPIYSEKGTVSGFDEFGKWVGYSNKGFGKKDTQKILTLGGGEEETPRGVRVDTDYDYYKKKYDITGD